MNIYLEIGKTVEMIWGAERRMLTKDLPKSLIDMHEKFIKELKEKLEKLKEITMKERDISNEKSVQVANYCSECIDCPTAEELESEKIKCEYWAKGLEIPIPCVLKSPKGDQE